MDNFTLLTTLNIVLLINVVFTFIITKNAADYGVAEWRAASILVASGFFLLIQQDLHPFIKILISNYLIMTGFYFQISAALVLEFKRRIFRGKFIIILSAFFWLSFLLFTYRWFSTPARIILISLILLFLYGYYVISLWITFRKKDKETIETQEILIIFSFSALFYLSRTILTAAGTGAVKSILDDNLITSITFTYLIVYNLVYLMGMSNASLRLKGKFIVREKEKMSFLFGFLKDTARHLDIEELYVKIGETLKKSIGMDSAAIYLLDEKGENLDLAYAFNDLDLPLQDLKKLKLGEGISGTAAEKDQVVEVNIDSYPIKTIRESIKKKGVKYLAGVPLKTSDGIIGAISVVFTTNRKISLMDKDFFRYLGEQIGLVLQNALLYKKVNDLANRDLLTKLYNRRRMIELIDSEIKRYNRNRITFSVAMADLDDFKMVNDTAGHKCGDELLIAAASTFISECRETDIVCRWGGEEFLFLFINSNIDEALVISERIRSKFEQDHCECAGELQTTLSIGIAEYADSMTRDEIIVKADNALYAAKRGGKNRIDVSRA